MNPGLPPKTLLTALLSASPALTAAAAQKPNSVHIVAADLGWKDVGFNGCTDFKTPNIDKLAAGGAKLTHFYAQPMCTPTRAALMTAASPEPETARGPIGHSGLDHGSEGFRFNS